MQSHLLLLLLFSVFVSLVLAVLVRDEPRDQWRLGAMLFGGFVLAAVLLGWVMYPIPL